VHEDAVEPKRKKAGRMFGRARLPRLVGLDLRTHAGKAFSKHYRLLVAEFGVEQELTIRELAGVKASIEKTQAEMLSTSLEPWEVARAREALPPLFRVAQKLEAKLQGFKQDIRSPAASPAAEIAAAIRAKREVAGE
jgi:hypothetical protein